MYVYVCTCMYVCMYVCTLILLITVGLFGFTTQDGNFRCLFASTARGESPLRQPTPCRVIARLLLVRSPHRLKGPVECKTERTQGEGRGKAQLARENTTDMVLSHTHQQLALKRGKTSVLRALRRCGAPKSSSGKLQSLARRLLPRFGERRRREGTLVRPWRPRQRRESIISHLLPRSKLLEVASS